MEGFNDTFNATMYAVQLISEAYIFCYENLKKSNIPVPAPDQVLSMAKTTVSYTLSNSPAAVQQLYSTLAETIIQSNLMGLFLTLLIMYIFYCVFMATVRWFYRIVYGFIRFSVMILLLGGFLYIVQYQMFSSTPTDEQITKSYDHTI